jgi:hypothetical protein
MRLLIAVSNGRTYDRDFEGNMDTQQALSLAWPTAFEAISTLATGQVFNTSEEVTKALC